MNQKSETETTNGNTLLKHAREKPLRVQYPEWVGGEVMEQSVK